MDYSEVHAKIKILRQLGIDINADIKAALERCANQIQLDNCARSIIKNNL